MTLPRTNGARAPRQSTRIAAVGDLHCPRASHASLQPLLAGVNEVADVLLLCGDLTDYGLPEEAHVLARELAAVRIPIVAVLGNHDFESGKHEDVRRILTDTGVTVLDGDTCEHYGIGFAGVKGFGGGFGSRALAPWGEDSIKRFVHEAIDEALKLESALARLRTFLRIVLLHYSPIEATVTGEPREVFPFLGSSRLEEPLSRYPVTAVFHGHAHHGVAEGRTRNNVPVYNVSRPLLERLSPERPLRIVELAAEGQPAVAGALGAEAIGVEEAGHA